MQAAEYFLNDASERITYDLDGRQRKVTGGISAAEARAMQSLITEQQLCTCVETGVAFGVSTVAICDALKKVSASGKTCKLYGVDPCQFSEHGGSALAILRRCGLDQFFELLEGKSHFMLPKLLEQGVQADFVFVDGWHTFDYTLIDVFLADPLLGVGGYLLMHDYGMPSKKKVWRYLATHRKYVLQSCPRLPLHRRVLSAGKQTCLMNPRRAVSILRSSTNLIIARKTEHYEPPHDFFRNF